MTRVLCAGIATLDQVFRVDPMPSRAEKYRARDLAVTGGGTAANAAVAIARLGGAVSFYGALGDDRIGDEIAAARAAGVPAILDGDRAPSEVPDLLRLATHVAFSAQAAKDLTGLDDPRAALASLAPSATTWFGVTNGAEGAFFLEG